MVEWSWRVESSRSVQFGSWSGNLKMDNGIRTLIGRSVEEISLVGRLPELYIHLSAGRWVHTFMTREGGPEWDALSTRRLMDYTQERSRC